MRVIERLWGSRKFAVRRITFTPCPTRTSRPTANNHQSFIISTLPYTSLLPPLLLALIVRPLSLNNLNYLPAGPTAIVFAILAQYHAAIPSTYKYHITTGPSSSSSSSSPSSASSTSPSLSPLTLRLTDKSTIYFLALQLSLSQFPHSILPALSGWIIGHAWRAELLPGNAASWRVPGWVYGGDTASDLRRRVLTGAAGSGAAAARYEGLRRRLEGESRAATATATAAGRQGGEGTGSGSGAETGQRPLAGQILDQFRGRF